MTLRPNVNPDWLNLLEVRFLATNETAVAFHWSGTEYYVYQNGRLLKHDLGEWGETAVCTRRKLAPEDAPLFLRPIYVPGPLFHGYWLYLDGLWLNPKSQYARDSPWLAYIVTLCGQSLDAFAYKQQFYEWVYTQYPDGIFIRQLEEAYDQQAR